VQLGYIKTLLIVVIFICRIWYVVVKLMLLQIRGQV